MKKAISLMLFMVMLACESMSAAIVKGHVTDSINSPMAFATVWVEGAYRTSITALDGSYTLVNVPVGKHKICVSFVGYKKEVAVVDVKEDDSAVCNFVMQEACDLLPDVFVTPNGEPIEQFLMRMVAEHKKKLKDVVSSYDATGSLYWEADKDSMVCSVPNPIYNVAKFMLSVMKLGKLLAIEHDNPGVKFTVNRNLTFNGKIKGDRQKVAMMQPKLKQDEVSYLEGHSWRMDENIYDEIYDKFDAKKINKTFAKARKNEEAAEARGEEAVEDSLAAKYVGRYEEDGREVFILKVGQREFHIVDNIWQIKRAVLDQKGIHAVAECRELLPGVYLPVSFSQNSSIDMDGSGTIRKDLDALKKKDRTKMSAKEKASLDKEIASYQRFMDHHYWNMHRCFTWDYRNLVAAQKGKK